MSEESNVNMAKRDADEAELARMGYKQELRYVQKHTTFQFISETGQTAGATSVCFRYRNVSLKNFGVSFSIISVITGVPSLFLYGLVSRSWFRKHHVGTHVNKNTGGPAVMVWGWVVVSCFTMLVGLAMAEVCSAHPTSGGPYFWAAMLSPPEYAAFASWITGWFNLLGQVAVTTGISFAAATFISTAATLGTDFEPTAKTNIGVYAAVLVAQGLINTFGVHILGYLNNVSVWWHAIGTTALVIAILAKAPTHQTGKWVFQTFIDNTAATSDSVGWGQRASNAYVVIIGILMAQYTLTGQLLFCSTSLLAQSLTNSIIGFDASAHMTEETHNAAMSGSIGIVMAIGVSAVLGWFLILGLLFSIQDLDGTISSSTGQPVAQIFLDTVGERGAIVLMVIVIGAMFFCGTFSITSNSRMMYAFARDGGIPGHRFFHKVDAKRKSPVRTIWLACTLSFILGLPSLGSSVAFAAATSIATIGLYISYAIPIALRLVNRKTFIRGPFHLGAFSYPAAFLAVIWICFISIVFMLPQLNPVDSQTLNYAPVAVGIVIVYSLGFWLLSARTWFTGPIKQIQAEESGVDVMSPGEFEKAQSLEKVRIVDRTSVTDHA